MKAGSFTSLVLLLLLGSSWVVLGADKEGIVARVNGQAITQADVDREMKVAFPDRQLDPELRSTLQAQTEQLLIDRQLVLAYLQSKERLASDAEVELAIRQLREGLKKRGATLTAYLKARQLDEDGLRRALLWQISWSRFLEEYLRDENLERYFDRHRRDFDGTALRVAHILFPWPKEMTAGGQAAIRQQAQQVYEALQAGEIEFAEAVRKYSSGPSRELGGELGWIRREEPMPESFNRAAFTLELQEISPPTESPAGVHLIQCLEIRPGQKAWRDVRDRLEDAVVEYLFRWAADQTRPRAQIVRP